MNKNISNEQCITPSQMYMIFNARLFWRRLNVWDTNYIISRYMGIGSPEDLFGRMYLENSNFGDILEIVFGRNNANQLSNMLNQYSIYLRDLISAQLQGNTDAVNQYVNLLYQNADNRAVFLASINPYLNEGEWRGYLETYLQYTLEQINEFITGNFRGVVDLYDRTSALVNPMGTVFAQALFEYITAGLQCSLTPEGSKRCFTREQMDAIFRIRMFWFDMNVWRRAYMLSVYFGIGNPDEVLARLSQTVADYTNKLEMIFGETNIDKNLQLINRYNKLFADLVNAQVAGNTGEISRITEQLYQVANERAVLLASINPYWDENEWRNRLYQQTKEMINESTTFLTGDYVRNLDIFSNLLTLSESTGDYYLQGLMRYINSRQM